MNDNSNDTLTDVLGNTLYTMREMFKAPEVTPEVHTQPLYETITFRDCTHVGYDFSQGDEPVGMMDLWVRDLGEKGKLLILVRQGPRGEDYYPWAVRISDRPSNERWAVVYDLWKLRSL